MKLLYLPLECYDARYTSLLSSKDGWIESRFKKANIQFLRVEGKKLEPGNEIKVGAVLDAFERSHYSLTQIAEVVRLMQSGHDFDTIYMDDFWTPGIEAIPYIAEQLGKKIRIFAMLHAQSVDKYDFTAKMKNWMRHYEIGQSKYMAGIFVTSIYLKDLCEEAGLENVFYGGLPFNSEQIETNFPKQKTKKEQKVIYTSRFDEEKNPLLFLHLAQRLAGQFKFVMTTSANEIRSNSDLIKISLEAAHEKGIVEIKTGLSKKQYYEELQSAKYQVNTADQDWVSWTLLEALHFGCIPVYPKFRSFPEVLPSRYLYDVSRMNESMEEIIESMVLVIEGNKEFGESLPGIISHFDDSFSRYLEVMNR